MELKLKTRFSGNHLLLRTMQCWRYGAVGYHRPQMQRAGERTEYSKPVRKRQPLVGARQDQERQETKPRAKDAGSLSEAGSTPTKQRETQHGRL